MNTTYLILGAGISGLSCASKLRGEDYLILEREAEIGGYCRTFHQDGFVWDYAGHFFHFSNPAIQEEFADLLSGNDIVFNKKCTKIYYHGQYIDYPFQYNIHQLEKDEFIDCLSDLFRRPLENIDSFQKMLYAKFGAGISDKFLIPYNSKLYACDLNQLDIDAMGRFFPYAEPEEIIKGFRSHQKETYNDTFYYSNRGAEAFVQKIAESVESSRIHCRTAVRRIDLARKCVWTDTDEIHYQYLINTIPFHHFLRLAGIEAHASFSCNQVLVFNLGFDREAVDQTLHWVYYPDSDFCFYRVGFYNNILHQKRMSLYVELGFPQDANIDIPYWRNTVLEDLKKAGVVRDHKLVSQNAVIMNPAYVHICKDSTAEKERIKNNLEKYQTYTIGRYGDWTYCSIEDCILQAYRVISQIRGEG